MIRWFGFGRYVTSRSCVLLCRSYGNTGTWMDAGNRSIATHGGSPLHRHAAGNGMHTLRSNPNPCEIALISDLASCFMCDLLSSQGRFVLLEFRPGFSTGVLYSVLNCTMWIQIERTLLINAISAIEWVFKPSRRWDFVVSGCILARCMRATPKRYGSGVWGAGVAM